MDFLLRLSRVLQKWQLYTRRSMILLSLDINASTKLLNVFTRLTHWGRDKMAAIFRTTVSKRFSWMKIYEFRFVPLKFVPKDECWMLEFFVNIYMGEHDDVCT